MNDSNGPAVFDEKRAANENRRLANTGRRRVVSEHESNELSICTRATRPRIKSAEYIIRARRKGAVGLFKERNVGNFITFSGGFDEYEERIYGKDGTRAIIGFRSILLFIFGFLKTDTAERRGFRFERRNNDWGRPFGRCHFRNLNGEKRRVV